MKKIFGLAAMGGLVALAGCATGAGGSMSASQTPGVWLDDGARYTVTIKQNAKDSFFGQDSSYATTLVLGLEALRGGQDQRWRWTFADVSLDKMELGDEMGDVPLKEVSAIIAPIVRVLMIVGFECRVDPTGSCAELTNWSTWRGALEDAFLATENIVKLMQVVNAQSTDFDNDGEPDIEMPPGAGGVDQRTLDLIANIGLNILDGIDDQSAGAMTIGGPFGPFAIQGVNFNRVGAAVDYTRAMKLPYNSGNLIFNGTRTVESVDRGKGVAVVTSSSALDGKSLLGSVLKLWDNLVTPTLSLVAKYDPENGVMATAVGAMLRQQLEAALKDATITFEETTRGVVDLDTGLARESKTNYKVTLKGGGDFDWIEGAFTGDYTVTIADGAPNIQRIARREIAPPPPPRPAAKAMEPATPTPPAKSNRPAPQPKR